MHFGHQAALGECGDVASDRQLAHAEVAGEVAHAYRAVLT